MASPGPAKYTQTATGQSTACTISSPIGCGLLSGEKERANLV